MKVETILSDKKDAIRDRWHQAVLETYHPDTRRFFKKQKDQFANPVGHTLSTELEGLLQWIIDPSDVDSVRTSLDRIFRIRAVQDFSPARCLSFLFELKAIIRDVAGDAIRKENLAGDLETLDARIDQMVLMAFDIFVACREKLYELKANQSKKQVSALLRRAGLTAEVPSWDSPPEGGS